MHRILDPIVRIDEFGGYWIKQGDRPPDRLAGA
jgi:hypothetical protein